MIEKIVDDRVISFQEMKEKTDKDRANIRWGCKTGFPGIDFAIHDLIPAGSLVLISGRTGEGKSTLAKSITKNISFQGIYTLFFTYEELEWQFLEAFGEDMPMLAYMPMKLTKNTVEWIKSKVQEMKKLNGDKVVVFIDHLHRLINLRQLGNASLTIGNIVTEIAEIARTEQVILFLLCHLTKTKKFVQSVDKGETKITAIRPTSDDIRDSSLINAESSLTLTVWRDIKDGSSEDDIMWDNTGKVAVDKNRIDGEHLPTIKIKKVGKLFTEIL